MNEEMRPSEGYFPMFFNVADKKVLIVGAGTIARRRIETLLSFGAELTVAAPEWMEEIGSYAARGQIRLLKQAYAPQLLNKEYFMVIAATDCGQLNREICNEGRKLGILVNNASDRSQCDFYFPAIVKQGDIIAGVCAGGKDHRLVRRVAAGMRSWLKQFILEDDKTAFLKNENENL
ncbi:MAG: bifunctional precorrin-2 dehydrogenase/sirohydrochlorin ferrochelatase [Lachnospiraceae bacterium]|nr:bifunctional precorrin-2 dehydrogenase/sirohydrochlorin ferrochelatase [Lachnospiraceae bacterium]